MLSTGFAAMAWHGSSSSLGRDPYDCDFGVGFWGHATGSSAFVVGNLTGSLSCYLCTVKNASESSSGIGHKRDEGHTFDVTPTDSFHRRVYFAALGLDLQLEAGQFEKLTVDPSQRTITASLATAPYQSDSVRDIKISPALVPLRGRLVVDSPGQGEAVGVAGLDAARRFVEAKKCMSLKRCMHCSLSENKCMYLWRDTGSSARLCYC